MCQTYNMWFHLIHGLLLTSHSFCFHCSSPHQMGSGLQEWTQCRRQKVATGFVPGQLGIHFFIMSIYANAIWMKPTSITQWESKARRIPKSLAERGWRAMGGNWPAHFLPEPSHHSTPLLCFLLYLLWNENVWQYAAAQSWWLDAIQNTNRTTALTKRKRKMA